MRYASRISLFVVLACGLLALGAAALWAHPCEAGIETAAGNIVPMRCHYTGIVACVFGLIIAVVSASALVLKREVDAVLFTSLFLLSCALFVLSLDTPLSIGVCKSEGMACAATATWLRACGALSALASVAAAVVNPNRKRV